MVSEKHLAPTTKRRPYCAIPRRHVIFLQRLANAMNRMQCKFDPDIPNNCPPVDVHQGDVKIFRKVSKFPAAAKDFESDVRAGRMNHDPKNCQSWGCSIWVTESAVWHALSIFKFWRKKGVIVSGTIQPSDGVVKNTPSADQPEHHTYWKAHGRDPSGKFAKFIENGHIV